MSGRRMQNTTVGRSLSIIVLSMVCSNCSGTLTGNVVKDSLASGQECPANVIPFPRDTDSSPNCSCNCSSIPHFIIKCGSVNSNYSIQLLQGYCMTLYNGSVVVGGCPYGSRDWNVEDQLYYKFKYSYITNNSTGMCDSLNRTGPLCAKCKKGHGIALYSNSWACKNCTLNSGVSWALYLTLETVPVIVFFLVVVFFNIRATSPPMTGFVFFSQITISTSNYRYLLESMFRVYPKTEAVVKTGLTFYGVWNLDFFRELIPEFCVSSKISNAHAVAFRYIGSLCPLLLVLISVVCIKLHDRNFKPIVCVWRPVHRCLARYRRSWNPNASIIDALATFLLLSYSTTVIVTFSLLYPITVFVLCGNAQFHNAMYFDGSKRGSSEFYTPATLVSVVVIIFPPLLLIVYQTKVFKKLLTIVRLDSWPPLHMFVDQFQGSYKDGTEGTYDYRFLSGVYLVFRIIFIVPYSYSYESGGYYLLVYAVLFIVAGLFQALVQPYKKPFMNALESLLFVLCALLRVLYLSYLYLPTPRYKVVVGFALLILASVPMCVFLCYLVYKFIRCVYRSEWFNNRALSFLREITRKRGPGGVGGALDRETLGNSFADRLQQPARYYGSLANNSFFDSFTSSSNDDDNELTAPINTY